MRIHKIRRANATDLDDVHRWRNDPMARPMYLNTAEIPREIHRQWFNDSLHNPLRQMYIGIADDGRKIGICRFDYLPAETTAEVFLTLNPEMRGMGLSSELLRMSIDTLSEPLGPDTRLWAKIRKQNVPSVRCFLAAGFQQCSHKEDWVFFTRSL